MSLAIVYSRAKVGVDAPLVTVEVHLSNGLPGFAIVGLPEASVREARDRVRSAIINSNFEFPAKKIIVNLAPADLPKEGGRFDLAIAIGILAASEQVPMVKLESYEFYGELALSGLLRPVMGILPAAIACTKQKRQAIVSIDNQDELALLENDHNKVADSLLQVCAFLHGQQILPFARPHLKLVTESENCDIQDVVKIPEIKNNNRIVLNLSSNAYNSEFVKKTFLQCLKVAVNDIRFSQSLIHPKKNDFCVTGLTKTVCIFP